MGVERVDLGHVKPWVRRAPTEAALRSPDKVILQRCLSLNTRCEREHKQTRWVQGSLTTKVMTNKKASPESLDTIPLSVGSDLVTWDHIAIIIGEDSN